MRTDWRPNAFDLVGYLLYVYAVTSVAVTLYSHNELLLERNTLTQFPQVLNAPPYQIFWINTFLIVFIALVYARNYIVMHGIDSRNHRKLEELQFINLCTDGYDLFERLLRFTIIFVVFASVNNVVAPVTEFFSAFRSHIVPSGNLGELSEGFTYYASVMVFLFLLFVAYDLVVMFACKAKLASQWRQKTKNHQRFSDVLSSLEADREMRSLLLYLNMVSAAADGSLHAVIQFRDHHKGFFSRQNWCLLYLLSPKFLERLSGALCIYLLALSAANNYEPLYAVLAGMLVLLYVGMVRRNAKVLSSLIKAFSFWYVLEYFLVTRRGSHDVGYFNFIHYFEGWIMNEKRTGFRGGIFAVLLVAIVMGYGVYHYGIDSASTADEAKQKVVVWHTESDAQAKLVLARLEQDFERRHPKVDLVIESISWNELANRLGLAIRTGRLPDVSHIQPFMAYSLVSKSLLSPITGLVNKLEAQHGPIFPAVKHLQYYDGDYYGLAYAVGTTFWVSKSDYLAPGTDLDGVQSWSDYLQLVKSVKAASPEARVVLPGGSPFFIDQLYGELLANAGGRLFNPDTFAPELNGPASLAVLTFFRDLAQTGALSKDWSTQKYLDQFRALATGTVFNVPVTYARASRTISQYANGAGAVSPEHYRWLEQPVSPLKGDTQSIATIDCEPFVLFKAAETRRGASGKTNRELALEFLALFYSEDYYPQFTESVPIQLTPIFETMVEQPSYLKAVGPWMAWHEKTLALIEDDARTRPILMPDRSEAGRKLPFLLEFQASRILSDAVSKAIHSDAHSLRSIADEAQARAEAFVKSMGRQQGGS